MPTLIVVLGAFTCGTACDQNGPASPTTPQVPTRGTYIVGAGGNFATIQAAVDAAPRGATVEVRPGTYAEQVSLKRAVRLQGAQAVLDGLAGALNGRDLGVHVLANDVEITGFVVQNFERGIVLDHVANCRVRGNEVRNNTSKDPQPISAGVTKADGIVLLQVQNSEVTENFVHDNGNIGLMIWQSSGGNTIRGNRFVNNGTQQIPGLGMYGAGIYSSAGNNTRNEIVDNEISNSHWGILIGSGPDSANVIRHNRIHGNGRAGIAVYGAHNRIEGNDATENGSLNLSPSGEYDLFEWPPVDNDWLGNQGRANF